MTDYISKKAVITAVKNFAKSKINEGKDTIDFVDTMVDLMDKIEKIPEVKIPKRQVEWLDFNDE